MNLTHKTVQAIRWPMIRENCCINFDSYRNEGFFKECGEACLQQQANGIIFKKKFDQILTQGSLLGHMWKSNMNDTGFHVSIDPKRFTWVLYLICPVPLQDLAITAMV